MFNFLKRIESERLLLRPSNKSDAPQLSKWLADPYILGTLSSAQRLATPDGLNQWIQRQLKNQSKLFYSIIERENNKLIGVADAIDRGNKVGEVLIIIGDAGYRSQGYGTEALKLLMQASWHKKRFDSLIAKIKVDNTASEKMVIKAGFTIVCIETNSYNVKVKKFVATRNNYEGTNFKR